MAKAAKQKIGLTPPTSIPLDKLDLHGGNVRHIEADAGIASLAADIEARGLLQSLSVRAALDERGEQTGQYGVQAGGRRLRALQLLVKQKKLAKDAPIPCIVRTGGFVEADSLAENVEREALRPLDQFRAFQALADKGQGEETIAAAFRVTPAVVRQRLRLAKASPVLLKAYEEEDITLEQLTAFCLTEDHARQEQVLEAIGRQWNKSPEAIRRMIAETAVDAEDRRALFVGVAAYEAAGGFVLRDLFDENSAGWLQDPGLLDRLVAEKLEAETAVIRQEGWKWVEAALDFPWNHKRECRALQPVEPALSAEEEEKLEAMRAELDDLDSQEEQSAEDKERIETLARQIAKLENKSAVYTEEQKAIAGVFVSLRQDGFLQIERGYVRRDDRAALPASASEDSADAIAYEDNEAPVYGASAASIGAGGDDGEEDGAVQLPDRLRTELTAYHSLGLRNAMAGNHRIAYLSVLHALALKLFYSRRAYWPASCLQIEAQDTLVPAFDGLGDFKAAKSIDARHQTFEGALPQEAGDLWDYLLSLDDGVAQKLFAHCASLTINAVQEQFARGPGKREHALRLATALDLDMSEQGFTTGVANFFGRVTKATIRAAVAEAKGEETANLLADMKKKDMAEEAMRLVADIRWLPEPLRTPAAIEEEAAGGLPAFLAAAE
jgi:ParB family transcriptional regulator, chromosome partitioning protein